MINIKETAISMAKGIAHSGISYVLVMEHLHPNRKRCYERQLDYSFHPRFNQPCWGQLRKYEDTHPGECTQPSNKRPQDLWTPFPDGKPIALAACVANMKYNKFLFSGESPWSLAYSKAEYKNGIVYVPDLNVDPTVLVHLLKVYHHINNYMEKFVKVGFSELEASVLCMLPGMANCETGLSISAISPMGGINLSVRRLMESMPHDYSGGTLEERVDYNRSLIEKIFDGSVEDGSTPWAKFCLDNGFPKREATKPGAYTFKTHNLADLVPLIREILNKAIQQEKKPERPLHIWKTTSGKTNGKKKAA